MKNCNDLLFQPMIKKRTIVLLLSFLVFLAFGLFVTNPYWDDQKIFFTAAYYADRSNLSFPDNVVDSWELKPIGNRLFFYTIYKITTLFISYNDKPFFIFGSSVIYGLISLAAIAVAFYNLRNYLMDKKIDVYLAFLITCLSFFIVDARVSLQAEHLSIILLICALAFALRNSRLWQVLSGLIITYLFLIKGVTGILGLIVYLVLIFEYNKYRSHLTYVFISNAASFLIVGLILYLRYPLVINDFIFSMLLAKIGNFSLQTILMLFGRKFLSAIVVGTPSVLFGILSYIYILPFLLRNKKLKQAIYLTVIWFVCFSVALLQGKGYTYHFSPLIISSVMSLIIFIMLPKTRQTINISIIVCLILFLPITYYWLKSRSANLDWFRLENKIYSEIDRKYSISSSPSVLFLTNGTANFYFDVKSYDRYFYPVSLSISQNNKEYLETESRMLNYNGEYILCYPHWFDVEKNLKLGNKIRNEYNIVYTSSVGQSSIEIFKRKGLAN